MEDIVDQHGVPMKLKEPKDWSPLKSQPSPSDLEEYGVPMKPKSKKGKKSKKKKKEKSKEDPYESMPYPGLTYAPGSPIL